jgi:chromosome segregation ATPase
VSKVADTIARVKTGEMIDKHESVLSSTQIELQELKDVLSEKENAIGALETLLSERETALTLAQAELITVRVLLSDHQNKIRDLEVTLNGYSHTVSEGLVDISDACLGEIAASSTGCVEDAVSTPPEVEQIIHS